MLHDKKQKETARRCFDAKLLTYCAMAGGALAAAQPAEGAVVYSGLKNLALADNQTIAVDLNGDGANDFNIKNFTPVALTSNGGADYSKLKANFVIPELENAIALSNASYLNLNPGAPIPGQGMSWLTASSVLNNYGFNLDYGNIIKDSAGLNIVAQGPFGRKEQLLGVRFQINSETHYGWIRYQGLGAEDGTAESGTIVDWAYEDTPYTPISADAGCSLSLVPGKISKVVSLISPIAGIVIRGEENAYFTRESTLDWGTDSVKTLLKIRISPKTIIALVRVRPLLMEGGETFKVTVDDCAGSLKVAPL